MSYSDIKITQADINENNVRSASDILIGNADDNKAVFDKLPEFIAGKHNELVDALDEVSEHAQGDTEEIDRLSAEKVNVPKNGTDLDFGEAGQMLTTKGNGETQWEDAGQPTEEQTQNAINNWLDEHPEATTTVEDESLTYNKLVKGTLGFVTPEMFGAKGDGVEDDTQAMQDALDFSHENSIRFVANNTYKTTDTINILYDAEINGMVKYSGTGVAILVGYQGVATNLVNVNVKIRVASDEFVDNPTSIGVYFGNTYNCDIIIDYVSNFYKGVVFNSYGKGNAYNAVYINRIQLFKIGLTLNSDLNGWVNENVFYNGSIRQKTGFIYQNDDIYILIDSSQNYNNNNNRFYNQCLEGAKTAIKILHGECNYFYGIRTEGTDVIIDNDSNASMLNFVEVTYEDDKFDANIGMSGYLDYPSKKALSTMNKLVFDTGFLGKEVAYNAGYASYKYCSDLELNDGQSYRAIESISQNGLIFNSAKRFFFKLDVSENKTKRFNFRFDADWTGGRIAMCFVDKDGNDIEDVPKYFSKSTNFTQTTAYGHKFYNTNSDLNQGNDSGIFKIPDGTCTLLGFMYQTQATTWCLKRFQIYSDDIATPISIIGEIPTLASIPTSTGYNGQFVKAKAPSASCIGWMYFNNQWNIVPL